VDSIILRPLPVADSNSTLFMSDEFGKPMSSGFTGAVPVTTSIGYAISASRHFWMDFPVFERNIPGQFATKLTSDKDLWQRSFRTAIELVASAAAIGRQFWLISMGT
jgi:hypothetical protein